MNCPNHAEPMEMHFTRYGMRWQCQVSGCTVACWDGETSTPADQQTRERRHACHEIFDPLWRDGYFESRSAAYRWLRREMNLPKHKCHIGMFDLEQCNRLLGMIEEMAAK